MEVKTEEIQEIFTKELEDLKNKQSWTKTEINYTTILNKYVFS